MGGITDDFTIRTSHYIIASATVVTMLAWQDLFKSVTDYLFPLERDAVSAKFIYTAILTVLVVMLIRFLPNTKKALPNEIQTEIEEKKVEKLVNKKIDEYNKLRYLYR